VTFRSRRRSPVAIPGSGAAPDVDEAKVYIEHARWLIEYHNRRSDSFSTRAVALLGFSGVMLALFGRASLPGGVEMDTGMFVLLVAVIALLILTAYFCLRTLNVSKSSAPGADDLRAMWTDWVTNTRRGKACGDVAETYLKAKTPDVANAVDDAIREASQRSDLFKNAAAAMLATLMCLAVLVVLVSSHLLEGN
jgi:ABC-type transport system involved in cytochrome bd biosynthesis fused ATPase/permease subunit